MRFAERLNRLGFATYADYLAGDHWREFKSRYRAAGLPLKCRVCGCGPVQLHHQDYGRLGGESLTDVVPLCRPHHVAVHEWLKANHKGVNRTGDAIAALGGVRPVKPPRTTKKRKRRRKGRTQGISRKADRFFTGGDVGRVVAILTGEALTAKQRRALAVFAGTVPSPDAPPGYLTNELYKRLTKTLKRLAREGKLTTP